MSSVDTFVSPITYYDIHVYFYEHDTNSVKSAQELNDKLKSRFPGLKVFELVPYPIGPHPIGMFELHLYNPTQFSEVVPWLALNRNGHQALIHPNTPDALRDHTEYALWLGTPLDLLLGIFDKYKTKH